MKVKWGNKNESLTLTVGGALLTSDVTITFEKMILASIERQVCDIHVYKTHMAKRVDVAELELKCLQADVEKGKNLWLFLWRFIKWPVAF
jgi:hypothetical protein